MSCRRLQRISGSVVVVIIALLSSACSEKKIEGYQGYVEGEFVYVASPLAGRLDHLSVQRGETTAHKAPLFALESERETAAYHRAEAQWQAAQAQLQDLRTGKRPPEVQVIEAQRTRAEALRQQAAAQWERDQKQFAIGGISQAQLEASRAQAEAGTAQVRELTHQIEVARLPNRAQQIQAQEAQVAAAKAAFNEAAWSLSQKTVASPRDGRVVDTLYREGEWVAAGQPVVKLLPPGNVKARFFVGEAELGALNVGQKVRLNCDSCQSLDATITYIANTAEYTPPVIFSNESRQKLVFMIEARPELSVALQLHPGQPMTVTLEKRS